MRTQGVETVSTSSQTLEEASIHQFFNLVATETLALFEHLEFGFLIEYDVFAPARRGEHGTMSHQNSSEALALLLQEHLRYSSCYP